MKFYDLINKVEGSENVITISNNRFKDVTPEYEINFVGYSVKGVLVNDHEMWSFVALFEDGYAVWSPSYFSRDDFLNHFAHTPGIVSVVDFTAGEDEEGKQMMCLKTYTYVIHFKDGSHIQGLLIPDTSNIYYSFIDTTNAAVWADKRWGSVQEFEDHYSNAPGVAEIKAYTNYILEKPMKRDK